MTMTTPICATPEEASRAATVWLILLQDSPDDGDLHQRFRHWHDASSLHAQAWADTRHTAGLIDRGQPTFADDWAPFLDKARDTSTTAPIATFPRRRMLRAIGLALVASVLAAVFGPGWVIDLQADYTTATAQTRTIELNDHSQVVLAPESAIRVHYSPGERHIDLLAGEAFFEVMPNPERPFRVTSDPVQVTVLGTGFNVRQRPPGTDVAVGHGRVRVDAGGESETLTVSQTAEVDDRGHIQRGTLPASQIASWRHNQLIAQDQPMGDVIDRMRPYYAGRIIVTDGALSRRPVTGVYDLSDPVNALRAIARSQDAVVRVVTPWILLVSSS